MQAHLRFLIAALPPIREWVQLYVADIAHGDAQGTGGAFSLFLSSLLLFYSLLAHLQTTGNESLRFACDFLELAVAGAPQAREAARAALSDLSQQHADLLAVLMRQGASSVVCAAVAFP
jgi:hypothetical protein